MRGLQPNWLYRNDLILVEMEPDICRKVTAERLRKVINGYTFSDSGGNEKQVEALGGGFRYCTLGEPFFDADGRIRGEVTFDQLARHVFFTETGEPMPDRTAPETPLIGECNGTAYYLLFNGIMGDKRANGGNVLTGALLRSLPSHAGPRIVFGEACRLSPERLRREGAVFKQIPYEVKVS